MSQCYEDTLVCLTASNSMAFLYEGPLFQFRTPPLPPPPSSLPKMCSFEEEVEARIARNREIMENMLGGVRDKIQTRIKERREEKRAKFRATANRRVLRRGTVLQKPRRASARLQGKGPVNYKEKTLLPSAIGARTTTFYRRRKGTPGTPKRGDREFQVPCGSEEAQDAAREAAEKLSDELGFADYKRFSPSIVGGGFWCDAPYKIKQKAAKLKFVDKKRDMTFLVGETEYRVVLLSRGGFSGGWRGLSIDQEYNVGDYGVFEWVDDSTIRLHVFRAADYE